MESFLGLDAREQELTFSLMEALTSSLDLSQVLSRAYEVLSRLLSADYAAICISKPGRLAEYDWMVAALPPEHFTRYRQLPAEDFVREAVLRHPNMVLRDTELITRGGVGHSLYQRCRELGMPLEHVMAVLLDMGHDWHGGFMLYRDRRQPFSERDRALLRRVTPMLTSTVRNCRLLGEAHRMVDEAQGRDWMLEKLLQLQGVESIVLAPPYMERMRTPGATALLDRWFPADQRGPHGLPTVLMDRLDLLTSGREMGGTDRDTWVKEEPEKGQSLRVTFVPLPEQNGIRLWGLLLQEVRHQVPVPAAWRKKLTVREVEVVECVLKGWDNQIIAEHLECSIGTVKKHLQRIFDKLGVDSRKALQHLAHWR
jgi:DNA-binding CsgD family transcriptional regulator